MCFHSDEMCGDYSNEFFELAAVQTHFAITNSIMIGGQRKQVQNIMTFKLGLIQKNWGDPIVVRFHVTECVSNQQVSSSH